MNTPVFKVVATAVFFLLIFLTGFWVSRSGKPYPALSFNVHKLIALGAAAYLIFVAVKASQAVPFTPLQVLVLAAAGIFALITIITGGLVSIEKPLPAFLLTIHHVFPYLTLASCSGLYYLLFWA